MTDKDIARLAQDCRFEVRPEEIEDLRETFRLLETMVVRMDDVLKEDVEEMVSPLDHVISIEERRKEDLLTKEEVLSNAPERRGDLFSVPGRKDS